MTNNTQAQTTMGATQTALVTIALHDEAILSSKRGINVAIRMFNKSIIDEIKAYTAENSCKRTIALKNILSRDLVNMDGDKIKTEDLSSNMKKALRIARAIVRDDLRINLDAINVSDIIFMLDTFSPASINKCFDKDFNIYQSNIENLFNSAVETITTYTAKKKKFVGDKIKKASKK